MSFQVCTAPIAPGGQVKLSDSPDRETQAKPTQQVFDKADFANTSNRGQHRDPIPKLVDR